MRSSPRIADAITAIPRNGLIATIAESLNDGEVAAVNRKFGRDPQFFTPSERVILSKAQISKDENAMRKAIDRLSKRREFREKMEKLR